MSFRDKTPGVHRDSYRKIFMVAHLTSLGGCLFLLVALTYVRLVIIDELINEIRILQLKQDAYGSELMKHNINTEFVDVTDSARIVYSQRNTTKTVGRQSQSRKERSVNRRKCGGVVNIDQGDVSTYEIETPNYPYDYPPNTQCEWYFRPKEISTIKPVIKLKFQSPVHIELGQKCGYDRLEVRDGGKDGRLRGTYCGINKTLSEMTFEGSLYIKFSSDHMINAKGFRAQISVDQPCGGTIYVDRLNETRTYDLQTPNYPLHYPSNMHCEWNFVLTFPDPDQYAGMLDEVTSSRVLHKILRLKFDNPVDVEYQRKCSYDVIEVRGGSSTGPLLGFHCGINKTISDIIFDGPIYVLFKSDHTGNTRGFKAQVSGQSFSAVYGTPSKANLGHNDVIYTHWGTSRCSVGKNIYTGVVAGFPNINSSSLSCTPLSELIVGGVDNTSYGLDNFPQLGVAFFSLESEELFDSLGSSVTDYAITCSLCHAYRTETFTVIGWNNCTENSNWMLAYNGYLMATGSEESGLISQPICMDMKPKNAEISPAIFEGPELKFTKPGDGFQWTNDHPIQCAVCIAKKKPYYF